MKKAPTNITLNQDMHKSAKISNTLTSFTHIVMQIMPEIYLIEFQFISSMVPSYNGVPRNSLKPQESVQMQKQEQCTKECYIKIGPETSLYQLVTPYIVPSSNYMRKTKQQLKEYWQIESLPKTDLSTS